MRVLMLSWEYPPRSVGGLAQHVYDLSHALAKEGHQITIITTGDHNLPEHEQDGGIEIYRVRPYHVTGNDFLTWVFQLNFAFLEKILELSRKGEKFDIVHAHDWLVAFSARAVKFGLRLPLIATIHATEHGRNQGLHNAMQRYISDVEWWLIYESWKIIVCSNYMKAEVRRVFQTPEDKIKVIPNGVDPNAFMHTMKEFKITDYAAHDEKIVFFVGRLVPEKGVHILIDAIPKVIHHYPKVKFVIGGKGPSQDYLRSKASILGVAEKCYFTGYLEDHLRNAFYKNAKVAVFPSTYEPFGIVALEAMAAKVPVVVSDTGGLSEIVNHGVDGLKAYPGNAESLADNILAILQDETLAQYLQKNAYKKINEEFSWQGIAHKTLDVYKDILNEASHFISPKKESHKIPYVFLNQKTGR